MTELSEDEHKLIMSISREPLRGSEQRLIDENKILWRQVHPKDLDKDVVGPGAFATVSPGAFVGTSAARYEVSTSMHPEVTAEAAYVHYTKTNASAGSYKVQISHVHQAFAVAIDDSDMQTGDDPVVGHAYIDLRGMPRQLQRRARSVLANAATKNKRVFPLAEQLSSVTK